jgi:hypothetical protein
MNFFLFFLGIEFEVLYVFVLPKQRNSLIIRIKIGKVAALSAD